MSFPSKLFSLLIVLLLLTTHSTAQTVTKDIVFGDASIERHKLDIYAPANAKNLPVVFWIHGGGWQAGDKGEVQNKPKAFCEKGFVFVSTNYRMLPDGVDMTVIIQDVAKGLGWVHKNIQKHGGDPQRIFVMGHSAGAQLAAIVCIDHRYIKDEGVPIESIKGCVPVDGDTYDIPAMIATAEFRQTLHGLPLPDYGHRVKFGNDPKKHIDYSAVTHIAKGKGIPPFLILFVSGHPDVTAQAKRLGNVLKSAEIASSDFGARETTHSRINVNLGLEDDETTQALFKFLDGILKTK
jgi:arylformamidase